MVDQATRGKPSVITRHGKPEAVVVGIADQDLGNRIGAEGAAKDFNCSRDGQWVGQAGNLEKGIGGGHGPASQ